MHWSRDLWKYSENLVSLEALDCQNRGSVREGCLDIGKRKAIYWIEEHFSKVVGSWSCREASSVSVEFEGKN